MAEVKYNKEQIEELESNKYVKKCSNKNLTFTKECKEETLKLWKEGCRTREIFKKLGFPEYIINSKVPEKSVNRWNRKLKNSGIIEAKRGRKQGSKGDKKIGKIGNLNDKEKIKYLEAEVEYLRELYKEKHGNYP